MDVTDNSKRACEKWLDDLTDEDVAKIEQAIFGMSRELYRNVSTVPIRVSCFRVYYGVSTSSPIAKPKEAGIEKYAD